MNAVKSCLVSIALCSSFASSLVYAGDCSDALIAESCACQSVVRSEREQPRTSDKGAPSARSKSAGARAAKQAKRPVVTSTLMPERKKAAALRLAFTGPKPPAYQGAVA